MIVHYLLFFLLLFITFLLNKRSKRNLNIYYFLVFVIFFIIISFRRFDIGNDTQEYYRVFEIIKQKSSILSIIGLTRYEIGYTFLCYFVARIFGSFTALLCIEASLYLLSILRFVNKYSKNQKYTIILLFSFLVFYDVMITARQCIAVSIFFFAIDYLISEKKLHYVFLIILAACFQKSALILLPICFMPNANIASFKSMLKWILLVAISLIALNYMSLLLPLVNSNYINYMSSDYSVGGVRIASVIILLLRLLIIIFVFIFKKIDFTNLDKEENVFLQLVILDCTVCGLSLIFNLFDRLDSFFLIPFVVFNVNRISTLQVKNRIFLKIVFLVLIFIVYSMFLIYRSNWYGLFPYYFN